MKKSLVLDTELKKTVYKDGSIKFALSAYGSWLNVSFLCIPYYFNMAKLSAPLALAFRLL